MTVLPERRIGREWDWLAGSGSHEPSEECSHAYIRSRVALGDGDAGGDASESSVCALLGAGIPYGVKPSHTGYVSIATNVYAIPRARGELSEAGPCRHMHGAALCRVQDTIIRKTTAFT